MTKDFKIPPDDPRLTAYALGELQGQERADIEAALDRDPAARAMVEQTRAFAQQLNAALANEPEQDADAPALLDDGSAEAEGTTRWRHRHLPEYDGGQPKILRFPQLYYIIGGLAAACFAVMIALREEKPVYVTKYVEVQLNPAHTAVTVAAPKAVDQDTELAPKPAAGNALEVAEGQSTNEKPSGDAGGTQAPGGLSEPGQPREAVAADGGVASVPPAKSVVLAVPPATQTTGVTSKPTVIEPPPGYYRRPEARGGSRTVVRTAESTAGTPPAANGGPSSTDTAPTRGAAAAPQHVASTTATSPGSMSGTTGDQGGEEVIKLSPFEVSASRDAGYASSNTLEGSRLSGLKPADAVASAPVKPRDAGTAEPAASDAPARTEEPRASYEGGDFVPAARTRLAWFSIPAATSSYAEVRRAIEAGRLPPRGSVRIEELLNYFPFQYAPVPATENGAGRSGSSLIAASLEVATAPWAPRHRLVRIGMQVRAPSAGAQTEASVTHLSVQVEFNPARVASYRLIGYENGAREAKVINTAAPFASVSAGQSVTALYEIIPANGGDAVEVTADSAADEPRYGPVHHLGYRPEYQNQSELLTVRVRYRQAQGAADQRIDFPLVDHGARFVDASHDFKFAAAVAEFGMILRDSPHRGKASLRDVIAWAGTGSGRDPDGYRSQFIDLARRTQALLQ